MMKWNLQLYIKLQELNPEYRINKSRVFDQFDVCVLKKITVESGWNYIVD